MKRTLIAGLNIWKLRGILWPVALLVKAMTCAAGRIPRGLIVEPSQGCTGGCAGCELPESPEVLRDEQLEMWLKASPAKPVTIHFSGKHSDPLASPQITELTETARKSCSMLSISTIGLGLRPALERLRVDRWIFSIPAATEGSWEKLRGNNRLSEALSAIRAVQEKSRAMVEVVLTIWKASANDTEAFHQLIQKENWLHTRVVFGRFDPEGNHFGRLENIALNHRDCPYTLDKDQKLTLRKKPEGCPLKGYLFLDAAGTLRPCPFTGDESPHAHKPETASWNKAEYWTEQKQKRSYPACEWCP